MYTILASQHPALRSESYEALIMSCMVVQAAGLELPTPQLVRWIEPFVGAYDNDPMYWQPYEVIPSGEALLKVWARGGYAYLASSLPSMVSIPDIQHVDPVAWHVNLPTVLQHVMDKELRAAFGVAIEQTNPLDAYWGERLTAFHDSVRSAASSGRLLTDAATIRRRTKRLKRSDFTLQTD